MSDAVAGSGKFSSLFFALGNPLDFSPAAWKPFFVPFDGDVWARDSAGGILYQVQDGTQYFLLIEYDPDLGMSLTYQTDSLSDDDFDGVCWVSLHNPAAMAEFVALDNGSEHARGSFLPPEHAWAAVEAFLRAPTDLPATITWMDADDMAWPDP